MADQRIIDACEVDKYLPIHQLNKLNEKGDKRYDIFPITLVQAVFDKTGIRLDAILSSFNYIFLPWAGSRELTRLQVQGIMRRKSLVICYRDLGDTIIIETCITNERGDDKWKLDESWKGFVDWLRDVIVEILGNLEDYPDIYQAFVDFLADFRKEITDAYMAEIEKEKQRAEAAESDLDERLKAEIQRATGAEEELERDKMPRDVTFKAETGAAGSTPSVKYDEESNTMTFVIPKGDKGDTGPRGPQGDKGEQGEAGKDGEDGADGQPGANGSDATVDTSQFATKEELKELQEKVNELTTGGDVTITLETLTFKEENGNQTYNGDDPVTVDLTKYTTEAEVNELIQQAGISGGGGETTPLQTLTFNEENGDTQVYNGTKPITIDLGQYCTETEVNALIKKAGVSGGGGSGGSDLPLPDLTFQEDGTSQKYDGTDVLTVDLSKYATDEELKALQSKVDNLSSNGGSGGGTNLSLAILSFSDGTTVHETYDGTQAVTVTADDIGALTKTQADSLYLTEEKANSLYLTVEDVGDYVTQAEYDAKVKLLDEEIANLKKQIEALQANLENLVHSTQVHNISVQNGSAGDGDLQLIFDNA